MTGSCRPSARLRARASTASGLRRQAAAIAWVVPLVLATGQPPARAQLEAEDPRPKEAKTACASGQVERGITLLAELYAATNDVSWVFNQGRCYQQNGRAEDAINRFREFLRRAKAADTTRRAEAEGFIQELEEDLRRSPPPSKSAVEPVSPDSDRLQEMVRGLNRPPSSSGTVEPSVPESAGAPRAVDVPVLTPPPVPPPAPESGGPPSVSATPGGGDRRGGRPLLISGAALGGAGLMALAAGILSSVKVESLESETRGWAPADWTRMQRRQQETANRYEVLQWVGYGAAALAFAGSGLCLYLDGKGSGESAQTAGGSTVSFLPAVQPGGASGRITFTF